MTILYKPTDDGHSDAGYSALSELSQAIHDAREPLREPYNLNHAFEEFHRLLIAASTTPSRSRT